MAIQTREINYGRNRSVVIVPGVTVDEVMAEARSVEPPGTDIVIGIEHFWLDYGYDPALYTEAELRNMVTILDEWGEL